MVTTFPKTKASVEELLKLLRCENCCRTLHEPYSNGVCTHTLCLECCKNSVAPANSRSKKHTGIGNVCPLCFIPNRPCDIKPHPQLHQLVLVTRRLAKLLGSSEVASKSGPPINLVPQTSLSHIGSTDFIHFTSPTPSGSDLRLFDTSDVTATVVSPVECETSQALQPVVVLTKNDIENDLHAADPMPPPKVPTSKGSLRKRGRPNRYNSEKSEGKNFAASKRAAEETGNRMTSSPLRDRAPIASPECSLLYESSSATPPASTVAAAPFARRSLRKAGDSSSPIAVDLKINSKGENVLHRAAMKNDCSRILCLLAAGVSPDLRDNAGWTPLHEAALRGYVEAAECLLTHGHATVDIPGGPELETPLHEAVANRRVEMVRLLLQQGANPAATSAHGVTPILVCARSLEANQAVIGGETGKRVKATQKQEAEEAIKALKEIQDLLLSAERPGGKGAKVEVGSSASVMFVERRNSRPVLMATGLDRSQRMQLTRVASIIHARVASEMSPEVTHLITAARLPSPSRSGPEAAKRRRGRARRGSEKTALSVASTESAAASEGITCPRTLKFLTAVLQGCWVLSYEWVETCDALKRRVEEEGFEVTGCSTTPNSGASRRSRMAREVGSMGLFHGFRFCLLGSFAYPSPDRLSICNLLTTGGASVFSRDVLSPSRLAYIAVDDPITAATWMVQNIDSSDSPPCPAKADPRLITAALGSNASGVSNTTANKHQLLAIYDPRAKRVEVTTTMKRTATDSTEITDNDGEDCGAPGGRRHSPENLVRVAMQMLRPRTKTAAESLPARYPPIRLVPSTWIMDCIAAYSILPLPTSEA